MQKLYQPQRFRSDQPQRFRSDQPGLVTSRRASRWGSQNPWRFFFTAIPKLNVKLDTSRSMQQTEQWNSALYRTKDSVTPFNSRGKLLDKHLRLGKQRELK